MEILLAMALYLGAAGAGTLETCEGKGINDLAAAFECGVHLPKADENTAYPGSIGGRS